MFCKNYTKWIKKKNDVETINHRRLIGHYQFLFTLEFHYKKKKNRRSCGPEIISVVGFLTGRVTQLADSEKKGKKKKK